MSLGRCARRSVVLAQAAAILVVGPWITEVHAADAERGLLIARTYCAKCHAIGHTDSSPFAAAPPFRSLHKWYSPEALEESLVEGIFTGHPSMPEFRFEPDMASDLVEYLQTLD